MKLGDVCEVISKGTTPTTYGRFFVSSGIPFLRAEDIVGQAVDFSSVSFHITNETHDFLSRSKLRPGDLLITIAGVLGRVGYIAEGSPESNCNQAVAFARVNPLKVDVEFLCYALRFPSVLLPFTELKAGGTIQNLNLEQVRCIEVPLPQLAEQKRIACKLCELEGEVERARTACEKQLQAAKVLPAAYLREVFESEEAGKWERGQLGEVCNHESGVWGDEADNSSDCYPVLRSNNIQNGKLVLNDIALRKINSRDVMRKKLEFGDIILTTSSGSKDLLGKSILFVQPPDIRTYLFSNFTMRLRPKSNLMLSDFLYFYLQSSEAKEVLKILQDTTTGLRNLDRKEFLNQEVPLPSLDMQKSASANLLRKMTHAESVILGIKKQLETINALPQAILRKAFSGEL